MVKYVPFTKRFSPEKIRYASDMNTIRDAAFCLAAQRTDLVFLKDIVGELEKRGIATSLVEKADALQYEVHKYVNRDSGEYYHFHPRAVAMILIKEFEIYDVDMICAALLHDVLEEKEGINKSALAGEFNEDIAALVDGVTKLGKELGKSRGARNLKKLISASADDPRVAIVKLGDNLHNNRTIRGVEAARGREKAEEIAQETIDVYSPLAHILGMKEIWIKLENAAYDFLYPEKMDAIRAMVDQKIERTRKDLDKVIERLTDGIEEEIRFLPEELLDTFDVQVERRPLGQLYRLSNIYPSEELLLDYFRLNFIVEGKEAEKICSIIHHIASKMYYPLPGRSRNYMADPTATGYKAIDDVLDFGRHGFLRVSFMTREMARYAELGILSMDYHDAAAVQRMLSQATHILKDEMGIDLNEAGAVRVIKGSAFMIPVKTEKGDRRKIPQGSTVRDLAYDIHAFLGHEAVAGRVDGREVNLDYLLSPGDYVVVLRKKGKRPTPDSLRDVRNPVSHKKIKDYLRKRTDVEIFSDGNRSFADSAQFGFLMPEDISRGPLAVEVFKRIFKVIDHSAEHLKQFKREFYPKKAYYSRKEMRSKDLDEDRFDLKKIGDPLQHYFSYVIGTGEIDSDIVVSEYLKLQEQVDSFIPGVIALAEETKKKLKESGLPELDKDNIQAQMVEKFLGQAHKIELEIGRKVIDSILLASKNTILKESGKMILASVRLISRFMLLSGQADIIGPQQLLVEFTGLAQEARKHLPARIQVTITCKNRKSLTKDIVNSLSDDLGLDIPRIKAVGEGEGEATIVFEITPESNLQRLQIYNIASEYGVVEIRPAPQPRSGGSSE